MEATAKESYPHTIESYNRPVQVTAFGVMALTGNRCQDSST